MSRITTHVLNTSTGRPVAGLPVVLQFRSSTGQPWALMASGRTDEDGRLRNLLQEPDLAPGLYALHFDTSGQSQFFPEVVVQFNVTRGQEHYHVPLLLSPYGYSTYRGS